MLDKTEKSQKEYYNKISSEYDVHYSDKYALLYRKWVFDRVLKNIDLEQRKVLDAMCGGGQGTSYFIEKKCKITAIDISDAQCEAYKNRYPNIEIVCSSILSSGLPDNSFDLILTDSLHHTHPHVNTCIKEFHRLLKKDGYLVLWEPTSGSIFDLIRKLWYKYDNKYFETNESSINLNKLITDNDRIFIPLKKFYGGNLAYVFVFLTMAMRIPSHLIKYYAIPLIFIEKILSLFQGKYNSLWFIALLRAKK